MEEDLEQNIYRDKELSLPSGFIYGTIYSFYHINIVFLLKNYTRN